MHSTGWEVIQRPRKLPDASGVPWLLEQLVLNSSGLVLSLFGFSRSYVVGVV